jgi:hypothetical protein
MPVGCRTDSGTAVVLIRLIVRGAELASYDGGGRNVKKPVTPVSPRDAKVPWRQAFGQVALTPKVEVVLCEITA